MGNGGQAGLAGDFFDDDPFEDDDLFEDGDPFETTRFDLESLRFFRIPRRTRFKTTKAAHPRRVRAGVPQPLTSNPPTPHPRLEREPRSSELQHYNRVVPLYTRTGDTGETGLFDGTRVSKAHPRIDACGDVDELNAHLGVVLATGVDAGLTEILTQLQRDLLALGARLADSGRRIAERVTKVELGGTDVQRLERWIDRLDGELPPLRRFIVAGGAPAGAALHLARTVCRRLERRMVALGSDAVVPELLTYVNRLSDLLFVLARVVNCRQGVHEAEW